MLASLQAARSAMDAERAPGGAGPQQADVVRIRLYTFESSLRALRRPAAGAPLPLTAQYWLHVLGHEPMVQAPGIRGLTHDG